MPCWSAVGLSFAVSFLMAGVIAAQPVTIRPHRSRDVNSVMNPANAWDTNAYTFASIGLERICDSACSSTVTASATFDNFSLARRPESLEVDWYAFAAFGVSPGNAGIVTARLDYDLGKGWRQFESYTWKTTSPRCPSPSDGTIACWNHSARVALKAAQDTRIVRVRVRVTASLGHRERQFLETSNLNTQAKIYDVRIVAESEAHPQKRPPARKKRRTK